MDRHEAAQYALESLKKAGAHQASLTASEGFVEELNADAGEFSLYRTLFTSSLSLKAIKDGKKGMADTNRLEKADIDEAVASCMAAAEAANVDEAEGIAEKAENKSFTTGILKADKNGLYDRIEEFMAELKSKYPKISLEQFIARYVNKTSLHINSNGVEFNLSEGFYDYSSMFSGKDGEKSTSFNGAYGRFTDITTKLMDLGLTRAMYEETERQFDPKPVEGKFVGPVVITPACLTDIVAMALYLFAGEGMLLNGTSIWKDKLGTLVAHPSLTVSMNPHSKDIVCGERYTADGYESVDADIIKNGVLNTFLLSRYGAIKTGNKRAGNLSNCFVIAPGDKPLAEIIGGIKDGLLVNRFSGGSPAGNGDFSGVAKNSFRIKDGKVAEPVSETMISGNLENALKSITGISRELVRDGVSVIPWVAMDGITISGK